MITSEPESTKLITNTTKLWNTKKIFEQNLQYANENARILKNAYFNQTALITDLLDANLLQVQAQFELEQSKMNVLKSYYSLKYETGTL